MKFVKLTWQSSPFWVNMEHIALIDRSPDGGSILHEIGPGSSATNYETDESPEQIMALIAK